MKKIVLFIVLIITVLFVNTTVKALANGIYVIHSSINEDYVIDANWGIASNGTNIQLWKYHGGLSQKWIVKSVDSDYYEIYSTLDETFSLDVNAAVFNNSSNIQLWSRNHGINQKWLIKEEKDGNYRIVSGNKKYSVDAFGAVATNGTNIQLWENNSTKAQLFKFEKVMELKQTIPNGIYRISSSTDENKVLNIQNSVIKNTANLEIYDKDVNKLQDFYVSYLNNGYYAIKPYSNVGYSLDVSWGKKTNGANVELFSYGSGYNQQWIISDAGDGYYNIISRCNNLALDINENNMQNGTNIQMYSFDNSDKQKFRFNKSDIDAGSNPIKNGYYFISSFKNTKKVLDINYGVMSDNTNVEVYDINYATNQKWYLEYMNNGYYKILSNKDSNYALQIIDNNVNIGQYTGADNQQWIIKKADKGFYIVTKDGKHMDLYMGKLDNNTNVQVFSFHGESNQKFKFIKTADGVSSKTIENGIYRISTALSSDMFLDVNGASSENYTNIQLWYRNSSKAQKFKITYLSNGYYKIVPLVDLNKSIDVAGGSDKNGTNLYIYDNYNIIGQQWIIKDTADGYYNIISNAGGNYIDVAEGSTSNGTNILMWQGNGSQNQKFKFIKSEMETRVVDVSAWQGDINWNKVANSGIYGAIIKFGSWKSIDKKAIDNIKGAIRNNIPYGVYWFSYSNTTNGANTELTYAIDALNTIQNELAKEGMTFNPILGIYYDLENWKVMSGNVITDSSYNTSKEMYDNIARIWIEGINNKYGGKYNVKIYANVDFYNNRFGPYCKSKMGWIAYWSKPLKYDGPYDFWQYTDAARLDGINTNVDMSYMH